MISTTAVLRQSGLRATHPRLAILGWLQLQDVPVRVDTVWEKTRRQGVNRVTVYRTLETLERAGVVRQVDLGHGHAHYEFNDRQRHHHHLVCESCGSVRDVRLEGEASLVQTLQRRYRFSIRSHTLEFFGRCFRCRGARRISQRQS